MSKVGEWLVSNKLSLNVEKTKYMIFTNRVVSDNINLVITNNIIMMINEIKFLAVIIDMTVTKGGHCAT